MGFVVGVSRVETGGAWLVGCDGTSISSVMLKIGLARSPTDIPTWEGIERSLPGVEVMISDTSTKEFVVGASGAGIGASISPSA
jgi:F420-0:gamma-glutamyl ligase